MESTRRRGAHVVAAPHAAPRNFAMPAELAHADLLEDILRNAYVGWWRYLEAKVARAPRQRNQISERALKYLPGSYKLWHAYLADRRDQVKLRRPGDAAVENVNRAYERALVYMHKMPRIWLEYLRFLMGQPRLTATRRAFDRALRALPITQHERVWELYLEFAKGCPVKETAVRVYRRYLKYDPEGVEEYVAFLLGIGRVSEAALKLAELLNRESFTSKSGKSRHKMWMELTALMCKNPLQARPPAPPPAPTPPPPRLPLGADPARPPPCRSRASGSKRSSDRGCAFTGERPPGARWPTTSAKRSLSRRGTYEEGISSVLTVRDFSMLDAYTQFEESMIAAQMEAASEPTAAERARSRIWRCASRDSSG